MALGKYLREVLPVLQQRASAPPQSLNWSGLIHQLFKELISLPTIQQVVRIVGEDSSLSQSLLRYPPLYPESGHVFPTEQATNLFFLYYVSPLLKRYVLEENAIHYFWSFSQERATRLCKDLESYARVPQMNLLFIVPLIADFDVPGDIVELGPNFVIRPFRVEEQQHWNRLAFSSESKRAKYVLEWCVSCTKGKAHECIDKEASETAVKAIGSLRVLGADVWIEGIGYAESPLVFTADYPAGVVYVSELLMPRTIASFLVPQPFKFTKETIEGYCHTWGTLKALPHTNRLILAMMRLNDCYTRLRPSDEFVDAWVGLDALAGQEGQELGYAISNRLSFLIAKRLNKGPAEAEEIRKQIRESYRQRGAVIHPRPGKGTISEQKLYELRKQAIEWLRQGILSAIRYGYTQDIPQQIDTAIINAALP